MNEKSGLYFIIAVDTFCSLVWFWLARRSIDDGNYFLTPLFALVALWYASNIAQKLNELNRGG